MGSHKCEYCKKTFKQRYTLLRHQKKAKYCIAIQKNGNVNNQGEIHCKYCNLEFSRHTNQKRHLVNCKSYKIYQQNLSLEQKLSKVETKLAEKEHLLTLKDAQIEKLQNVINQIAMKPRTVNNYQQILNLQPVTQEYLDQQASLFCLEHFKRGIDGVVDYALEYPLKSAVICNDQNRKQFTWRDGDNDNAVISDPKMFHLTQKLCHSLEDRSQELLSTAISEITEECNRKIEEFSTNGDNYLAEVHREKMHRLIEIYNKYSKNICTLGKGEISDAISEFSHIMAIKIQKSFKT